MNNILEKTIYEFIIYVYENNIHHTAFLQQGEKYYIKFKEFKKLFLNYSSNSLIPKERDIIFILKKLNHTFRPAVRKQFNNHGLVSRKAFAEFKLEEMVKNIKKIIK